MFSNRRVEPFDFGQDQVALLVPLAGVEPGLFDIGGGNANSRQRRPQVVAERRQQRRLQLLALARQLRCLALIEKLRALDGDGGDRRRVRRASRPPRPPRRGEQADRPGAGPQRNQLNLASIGPTVRWPE